MPYRVAIIGAGSAGPAAALMLDSAGHDVTLFERAQSNLPVGAGFMLQPSGMSVLENLDLLPQLIQRVDKITSLYCKNTNGKTLLDLQYKDLAPHLFGAGTHRPELLDILLTKIKDRKINLLWDHEIIKFYQYPKSERITLTDQRGKIHGAYDLVLLCDGSRSHTRTLSGLPHKVKAYPWGALWFIGQRDNHFPSDTLWQSVNGTHELVGFLPTGTSSSKLSLFWSIRLDQVQHWQKTKLDHWKEQILRHAPQSETFLSQIHDHSQIPVATYYDVTMKQWHGNRIAILGDAAHALSPQLGQGVNLALMDAQEICLCLENKSINLALTNYSIRRRRHLNFYQNATRALTPLFQSDYPALGLLRDFAFPFTAKQPWISRQMTASMAGLKTGPFSRMPIPPLSSIS